MREMKSLVLSGHQFYDTDLFFPKKRFFRNLSNFYSFSPLFCFENAFGDLID